MPRHSSRPSRLQPPHRLHRFLDALDGVQCGGETDCGTVLHESAERLKRRGLVIVISDLIDNEDSDKTEMLAINADEMTAAGLLHEACGALAEVNSYDKPELLN